MVNQLNVHLGDLSALEVESDILDLVGSYGKQLGQISDALIVLLRHIPYRNELPAAEKEAFAKFEAMTEKIAVIKEKHGRNALRP